MTLSPGSRIGPYEVTTKLGEGGMGEVYRARDTKLSRDVALKILPPAFATDPDRLARFKREALVLASLNHPNIASVYGFEDAEATHALVMELVEGDDLSTVIQRGALPFGEAIPIARQIADALEAAHESGVIHRDLKPGNIKVRPDGTVKVLDFGLAKAMSPENSGASTDAMNSPTMTARATQLGMILGTAAYMAPEQARGKSVDRRADIWAFGVVLYEMLSGRRAFEGEDVSVTLANVIKEDARWDALPADVPAPVRRLLKRCLEKDPRRRLSAIGDARFDLELENSVDSFAATPPGHTGFTSRLWPALAGALLTALAGYALWPRSAPDSREPIQFSVHTESASIFAMAPRISPDGRLLAYSAPSPSSNGTPTIWIRSMDGVEPRPLQGTLGAAGLFWSPKSDVIGYFVGNTIYRISAAGGPPVKLAEIADRAGATWTRSGDVIAASFDGRNGKLWRVPGQGGVPVELPRPKATGAAVGYVAPVMLSDDKHILYFGWTAADPATRGLFVGTLDGAEPVRLTTGNSPGEVSPGHLLFVEAGALVAQPFDQTTLTLSGSPIRIADGFPMDDFSSFSASTNGVLAYRKGEGTQVLSDLAWFDRTGKKLGTVGETMAHHQVRLSPDQRKVVIESSDTVNSNFRLSILDLGSNVATPLTDEKLGATDPVWSPASDAITFVAFSKNNEIFTQHVGTANPLSTFPSEGRTQWLSDASPDGKTLLLHAANKLYTATPGEPKSLKLVLEAAGPVDSAHFSPDGRWVAYQVDQGGATQVWIAAFPAFDQRRQVSSKGGGQPVWRADGGELFYLSPAGKLMAVRAGRNISGPLDLSPPSELFQSPLTQPSLVIDQYWPAKDGQRFIFISPAQTTAAPVQPITVVVNWTSLLRRGGK